MPFEHCAKRYMSEVKITKTNFEAEVTQEKGLVLVDFWAAWCGPCQMLAPVLQEVAEEYQGRVKVGKANVDEEMELAQQFQVASIPTLILFKDGQPVTVEVGYKDKGQLKELLDNYLV